MVDSNTQQAARARFWTDWALLLVASTLGAGGCASDSRVLGPDGSAPTDGGTISSDADVQIPTRTASGRVCSAGFRCVDGADPNVVWVMRTEGNINGPTCTEVCRDALPNNCAYYTCAEGTTVAHRNMESFAPIARGLGFECRAGGCWSGEAPGDGQYLVSIDVDERGARSCYFPNETVLSCDTHPGNANCFGERYASVCPCTVQPLDRACNWRCAPHDTTRATWRTQGTSCLARINYWRKRACEEGWVECPPAGLPPMTECTACHECSNSESEHDATNGAHSSFTRCGESAQGQGGGATCADVIDGFVAERAPDRNGVMRCEGHCGPILRPGCRSFSWGKDRDSGFHTLNWGACNAATCSAYCAANPGQCFTHATSPTLACDDPDQGAEPNPRIRACQ
jgi:hypothetical protein